MARKASGKRKDRRVLATEQRAEDIAASVVHSYDLDMGSQIRVRMDSNARRTAAAHRSLEQLEGELEEHRLHVQRVRERITVLERSPVHRFIRWLRRRGS